MLKNIFLCLMMGGSALSAFAGTFTGERSDFRDETIYFAMTTRFYDGDAKNNVLSWDKQDVQIANGDPDWRGDFAGLIDKLDYIKALGFTAIWITPVVQNASGEDYHGYHAMDFSSVDLRYESRKEWGCDRDVKFQDLIDAAHAKGMKIILDIVLQHTSNFGEVNLNPLFERNQKICNQATPAGSLIPNSERLSDGYFEQTGNAQYQERFKYFKNPQYDPHNLYHHYGTGWNWDLPNRWWGQIAGDCVDLNTENNTVAEYLVKCYGKFIEMGVDGFRIDTTGHIARLTFNKQFIPQLKALGEKYKNRRLNGCEFYMFGECCARFGSVIYRGQHNLSSHFYTWKSPESLLNQYDGSQQYWDTQVLHEGHDSPVGPMVLCEQETEFNENSKNAFMQNGAWHEPDYSKASGFNVIDFPMHYNFNSAGQAIGIAKEGDHYYNDATYNVVYVDSHDYCPGPNDGTRFNGGTAQWAENLSLMFTFRGIPCIYYGSEVEFKKGKPIDVGGENNRTPRKDSGRAYFGNYLEGSVSANDFGEYQASGNVEKTLGADLAQHIIRLNKIRAAVPALRKGQYTFDGCSGNIAFKRAYKESYALVCINGGATFSNVPEGTYTDLVTGAAFTPANGTIAVSAPSNKGQLRVLVKDWKGGKVGDDGKFIYTTSEVAKGGNVEFPDLPATRWYGPDDVEPDKKVKVTMTPNGGTFFNTRNVTITAQNATSAWYKIGEGEQHAFTTTAIFTIGEDMNAGDKVTVSWSATGPEDTKTGSATFIKAEGDGLTIAGNYNIAYEGSHTKLHYWGGTNESTWPGITMKEVVGSDGKTYKCAKVAPGTTGVVFNNGSGSQTKDLVYSGEYVMTDEGASTTPVTFISTGGEEETYTWKYYYQDLEKKFADKTVYTYVWDDSTGTKYLGNWPGKAMTKQDDGVWALSFETTDNLQHPMVIFHDNSGTQTADLPLQNGGWYSFSNVGELATDEFQISVYGHNGAIVIESNMAAWIELTTLDGFGRKIYVEQGTNIISHAGKGMYVVRAGHKVLKVVI